MFGRGRGELGMAVAAERMESGFGGLYQVGARTAVAIEATADTGPVDEVVMTGDAVDARVFVVREIGRQGWRARYRGFQQARARGWEGKQREHCDACATGKCCC